MGRRVICYDVWGRIGEGTSEHLGFYTNFRKAEREAKCASRNFPFGAEIDCNIYDADSVKDGEPDCCGLQKTLKYVAGKYVEMF